MTPEAAGAVLEGVQYMLMVMLLGVSIGVAKLARLTFAVPCCV